MEHKVLVYFKRKKIENIPEMSLWEQVEQSTSIKRFFLLKKQSYHTFIKFREDSKIKKVDFLRKKYSSETKLVLNYN